MVIRPGQRMAARVAMVPESNPPVRWKTVVAGSSGRRSKAASMVWVRAARTSATRGQVTRPDVQSRLGVVQVEGATEDGLGAFGKSPDAGEEGLGAVARLVDQQPGRFPRADSGGERLEVGHVPRAMQDAFTVSEVQRRSPRRSGGDFDRTPGACLDQDEVSKPLDTRGPRSVVGADLDDPQVRVGVTAACEPFPNRDQGPGAVGDGEVLQHRVAERGDPAGPVGGGVDGSGPDPGGRGMGVSRKVSTRTPPSRGRARPVDDPGPRPDRLLRQARSGDGVS